MWAHSHVWGTPFRQSPSACRLESIDPVTFLDRGGRACHNKSDRDALYFMRLSSEPQLECGEPGPRTWQPIAGCLGGRGQHPANADGHYAAGEGPAMECTGGQVRRRVNSRLLPCWCPSRTRDQTAVSVIIVQTNRGRGTASASLLEACVTGPAPAGASLWLART